MLKLKPFKNKRPNDHDHVRENIKWYTCTKITCYVETLYKVCKYVKSEKNIQYLPVAWGSYGTVVIKCGWNSTWIHSTIEPKLP